jgi:hypothetical protein
MTQTKFVRDNIIVKVIIVVLLTWFFVYLTNLVTLTYVNKDSEYASQYQSEFEKGYLSEDEVAELRKLEKQYINDQQAQNVRASRFFGTLIIGMLIYSIVIYLIRVQKYLSTNTSLLSLVSAVSAGGVSGSFWQAIFWALFFYIGYCLANKKMTSPDMK